MKMLPYKLSQLHDIDDIDVSLFVKSDNCLYYRHLVGKANKGPFAAARDEIQNSGHAYGFWYEPYRGESHISIVWYAGGGNWMSLDQDGVSYNVRGLGETVEEAIWSAKKITRWAIFEYLPMWKTKCPCDCFKFGDIVTIPRIKRIV